MLKLFIKTLRIESAGLIVHQTVEMPSFLVFGVYSCSPLRVLHNNLVVLLSEVNLMLVVPLSQFEVALRSEGGFDVFLFFLNKACQRSNGVL